MTTEDQQPQNLYLEVEAEQVRNAKGEAQRLGFELLTPLATARLFRKSPAAVRKATRNGHVEVVFDLWVTDRNVALIRLRSAIDYWGQPDVDTLEAMRASGHTMAYRRLTYNILHPTPLLTLRNPEELESG